MSSRQAVPGNHSGYVRPTIDDTDSVFAPSMGGVMRTPHNPPVGLAFAASIGHNKTNDPNLWLFSRQVSTMSILRTSVL
jgi:hypothetical protein